MSSSVRQSARSLHHHASDPLNITLTPNYLFIENNLTKDDLEKIKQLINSGKQVDGIDSVIGNKNSKLHELKNNTEIALDYDSSVLLNQIIYGRMDAHAEFFNFTAANSSACPILSRMVAGNYYKPHQDDHLNGDSGSTTYFLSDPETYEGGELCLWIDNKEQRFKPPAGSSVTYRTGIPHRVNTVTKGIRDVAVSWASFQN